MNKRYALFIGRWQPFHNGHDFIIRKTLDAGEPVAIGVRDTPISEGDPYTLEERCEMIGQHYADDDVVVFPIPDIKSVNIGRDVGYDIVQYDAPASIEGISATSIRKAMADGDLSWMGKVPPAIAVWLQTKGSLDKGAVIWLTGLSGAGKSTIADRLDIMLRNRGLPVAKLDGDMVRQNFTKDLGYSKQDRDENIYRIANLAAASADCGMFVLVSAISPYDKMRQIAKSLIGSQRFHLIYVKCGLETLKSRDPKGLYAKALAGEITAFTGVSDPYDEPQEPDQTIDTEVLTPNSATKKVFRAIAERFGL